MHTCVCTYMYIHFYTYVHMCDVCTCMHVYIYISYGTDGSLSGPTGTRPFQEGSRSSGAKPHFIHENNHLGRYTPIFRPSSIDPIKSFKSIPLMPIKCHEIPEIQLLQGLQTHHRATGPQPPCDAWGVHPWSRRTIRKIGR